MILQARASLDEAGSPRAAAERWGEGEGLGTLESSSGTKAYTLP